MTFKYKKSLQTITLLLVLCMANGYVFAIIPDANASTDSAKPKALAAGILNAFDARSVRVNGNIAQDGMTILSGAKVETGNNGGATIDLPQIGKVELNPETVVQLVFTDQQIDLQVLQGQAKLTSYKGVKGVLTDETGNVMVTDPSLEFSSVGNNVTALAVASSVPVAGGGLFGLGVLGTVAAVGGLVGVVAVTSFIAFENSQSSISNVQP